jgi:multiple sugar transport system permease protein
MDGDVINIKPLIKKKRMSRKTYDYLVAYSFVLPNVAGYVVMTMLPIFASFLLTMFNWGGGKMSTMRFVGPGNYLKLFKIDNFRIALGNTLYYAVGTVPIITVLALLLALLLNKDVRGRNFVRSACFFPHVGSVVTVAAIWNLIFNPDSGPVNMFLSSIGVKNLPGWASDIHWAMPMVMSCVIWRSVGYFCIIYLAALQGIPKELYEAARIDGANPIQSFRRITVPMLTPTTFFVVMMLTIGAFQSFDLIYVLTKGGPGRATKVLALHIYESFTQRDYGYASTVAVALFVIVLIVTLVQFRAERKWVSYM